LIFEYLNSDSFDSTSKYPKFDTIFFILVIWEPSKPLIYITNNPYIINKITFADKIRETWIKNLYWLILKLFRFGITVTYLKWESLNMFKYLVD
jgi:hypothetical protein